MNKKVFKAHITAASCIGYAFEQCLDTIAIVRDVSAEYASDYNEDNYNELCLLEIKSIVESYQAACKSIACDNNDEAYEAAGVLWYIPLRVQEAVTTATSYEEMRKLIITL